MVENKKGKSKRKEGLEVSRLSSTENKNAVVDIRAREEIDKLWQVVNQLKDRLDKPAAKP